MSTIFGGACHSLLTVSNAPVYTYCIFLAIDSVQVVVGNGASLIRSDPYTSTNSTTDRAGDVVVLGM